MQRARDALAPGIPPVVFCVAGHASSLSRRLGNEIASGMIPPHMIYSQIIRPLLFQMDPETAHHCALRALRILQAMPGGGAIASMFFGAGPAQKKTLWGLEFENPVGLAAGFDKNALVAPILARMGFGFLEVGAVSRHARPGNPRPRIFRLPKDRALINRMGLPNDGAEAIAQRLAKMGRLSVPLFANIVKTSDLVGDAATMAEDYVITLRFILPWVDGVTVNVSCPATPELKAFGKRDALMTLLVALKTERDAILSTGDGRFRPMLVKVSPDIDIEERNVLVEAALAGQFDGFVLTNTTTSRPSGLAADASILAERGGLSGGPLRTRALDMIAWFANATGGKIPIIGVGGIFTADHAKAALDAGASLVEIYTGYVYGGPSLPKSIVGGIAEECGRLGASPSVRV
jgi:dihydroorotate dehydrogenase